MSGEKNTPLLPSLLDRLTDDSHISQKIQACNDKAVLLEHQLQQNTNADAKFIRDCQREIDKHKQQAASLRDSVGSFKKIRDSVKRDLSWLMNSRSFYMGLKNLSQGRMVPLDVEKYPEAAKSVINYGLPDLTGRTASSVQKSFLEKTLKQVLLAFEPRIIPESLILEVIFEDSMHDHNVLMFDIDAMLWAEPAPVQLQIRSQFDLETGEVELLG